VILLIVRSRFVFKRIQCTPVQWQWGQTRLRVIRLLESVALLLREKTAPAEFLPVQSVIRVYLDVDGDVLVRPFKWLDDIPRLAAEYRDDKTA
jgi:hypothetical protein